MVVIVVVIVVSQYLQRFTCISVATGFKFFSDHIYLLVISFKGILTIWSPYPWDFFRFKDIDLGGYLREEMGVCPNLLPL
jgi:hypothetical protein